MKLRKVVEFEDELPDFLYKMRLDYLYVIQKYDLRNCYQIAKSLDISQSTAQVNVQLLSDKGLVDVTEDDKGKVSRYNISINDDGIETLIEILKDIKEVK